jgi:hypothetical protein
MPGYEALDAKSDLSAAQFIREGSAMIAVGPGKPADFILYEEFLSWKWPLFL